MFTLKEDEFWAFCLEIYAVDEVKRACLHLQDEMMFNVNILLLMMYLCKHDLAFDFDDIEKLEQGILRSNRALKKHRVKRRGIKQVSQSLYEKALSEELDMERQQQKELLAIASTMKFKHIPVKKVLSEQIAATCARYLTESRNKRVRALDTRLLSKETLQACSCFVKYL
ncbi:TIGR02444 family protein [Glaciecola siphonariae]|uniref:TIGR02444 family protein n=1 Tax=Glaciecola siphonariae TaxID=521012 RepID=A0ABV9LR66_9ALTE